MRMMRNPELQRSLWVCGIISLVAVVAAWVLGGWSFGVFTLVLCICLVGVHVVTCAVRYKKLAELSADIDRVLHGDDSLRFEQYSEGELGILQSELHKMTVRLREQKQQLMEDKRYLADSIADISHQIRTPLTSINLLVSMLAEPELTEKRRQELIRELRELLFRIDWLITALLKMSKLDAGTIQFRRDELTLRELIEQSCAPMLIPMELRGQELRVQAEGKVVADMGWCAEALGNVVKNCMEHTPEGGCISIVAQENALFSEIVISDNGSGIAPEDLPNIFRRFYKGKDSGDKSFGIGLALARMIITGQNGTIKAENGTSGGAVFTIRFYKGTV